MIAFTMRRQEGTAQLRARIAECKRWALAGVEDAVRHTEGGAPGFEATASISQVECFDPACSGLETVLALFCEDGTARSAWRCSSRRNVRRPLLEVHEAELRGLAEELAAEALREFGAACMAARRASWAECAADMANGADGEGEERAWAAALNAGSSAGKHRRGGGGGGDRSSRAVIAGERTAPVAELAGAGGSKAIVTEERTVAARTDSGSVVARTSLADATRDKSAQQAAMAGGWNSGGHTIEWSRALGNSAPRAGESGPAHSYGCPCCSYY